MKILFMDWNSYGNEDLIYWFRRLGHQVVLCPFQSHLTKEAETYFSEYLIQQVRGKGYDFIYSYNYYPVLSIVAQESDTLYVSWVYDNPASLIYSKTIQNPCNRIFVFDRSMYQELISLGVSTVFHLPLACNPDRLSKMIPSSKCMEKYRSDITFVGSTYCEPKQDFFSRLTNLSPYVKGYLDCVLQVQQNVYGKFLLYDLISSDVMQAMQKAYPYTEAENSYITPEYVYVNYFLARHVTAMERQEILQTLSSEFPVSLYTNEKTPSLPNVKNLGKCEYYTEMPYIFKCSTINLNITLKSIQTGIPLRVFDILGSRGFLITNYQEELLESFVPDEDLIIYESIPDLQEKCRFYLKHPELCKKIAGNGYQKACDMHSFEKRIPKLLESL